LQRDSHHRARPNVYASTLQLNNAASAGGIRQAREARHRIWDTRLAGRQGDAVLESSHIVAFAAATDLHRARAFYEQVLGLPVAEHNDFACVLDANGTMLRITAVTQFV
jgi:hypothetical protein